MYVSRTCHSSMLSPLYLLSLGWPSFPCSIGMFSQFSRVTLTTGQTTCGLLHAWNLFMYNPCHSQFLFRTKFTCERGCIFRSDHVRTVAHLPRWYLFSKLLVQFFYFLDYILYILIAQSSRANGVGYFGQTTCGLLHTVHVAFVRPYDLYP
jgi:hypothetical protein